ncbi:TOTE conflict system archaeo-eukaryotic primase domain-containing protein [Solidesulfovibrio alcoholivorans]|uniref:TOTE conflict system archaeo-eukaryotic primase domain-containing protein n=1 Tax=Solidesulfovibrio alcoholivorans TaxID=81406 RepID=UPI000A7C30BD|nr:reverse transcriptase domain-containing protein [Solidesulfovibrio alcoholivorans]
MDSINKLSSLVFSHFVARQNAYAIQDANGLYHTRYLRISKYTIRHMILNGLSFLTYQMLDSKKIKWCCLDFDISSNFIAAPDFLILKEDYYDRLIKIVAETYEFLNSKNIDSLVEFSGNRGFHLWIVFSEPILKDLGHRILKTICENIIVPREFAIDFFPATPQFLKKGIGQGVKIPISVHRKSNKYCYFIDELSGISIKDLSVAEIGPEFIKNQIRILENYKLQKPKDVVKALGISLSADESTNFNRYVKTRSIGIDKENSKNLDDVLQELSNCSILNTIISTAYSSFPEKSRTIIVGLLNKVTTDTDSAFGKKLLLDFFSRMPNFKEELTIKKLKNLNLQPITCRYLKALFPDVECTCIYKNIQSPVEIISGVTIKAYNPFESTKEDIRRVTNSTLKYTRQNDEVPLFIIESKLKNINIDQLVVLCDSALKGMYCFKGHYEFFRNEENSVRTLISLSPEDKVVTKFLIKCLHSFFYIGFSENSYGYKFNENYSNENIFYPWLQQWRIFKKGISSVVEDEVMAECFLIKLDIRSFYSSIDRQLLRVKIVDGPTAAIRKIFSNLNPISKATIENIGKLLVSVCDETVEDISGVPQGPAFARYLAEVYLMDFDKYVERMIAEDFGQYFRYVDDIFIVIDSEDKAFELNKNIISFLSNLNLEINTDKSYYGKVKDYRGKFDDYIDNAKYTIDHTSLNLSTKAALDRSLKELFGLLDGGKTKDIKNENISFFLTHFSDHPLVEGRLKGLEDYVLNLKLGRGSMFRNFFAHYIPKHLVELGSNLLVLSLEGLKREVFLNSLLVHIQGICLSPEESDSIRNILLYYIKKKLSKAEAETILVLMLQNKRFFDVGFFKKMDLQMIINALPVGLSLGESSAAEEGIVDLLIGLNHADFISLCSRIAVNDIGDGRFCSKLGDIFFNKMYNYIGSTDFRTYDPIFISDELLDDYHFACCLFSILPSNNDNFGRVELVWQNMVCFMNKRLPKARDIVNHKRWLEKASKIPIDFKRIMSLLALGVVDGIVPGFNCELQLYENFKKNILILVCITENPGKEIISDDIKSIVGKYFNAEKYEYLRWMASDPEEVFPFPDKNVCVKNIIYNDRLVLKKDNEILIRHKTNRVNSVVHHQATSEPICGYLSDEIFDITKKKYHTDKFAPIDKLFLKDDFFKLIAAICAAKENLEIISNRLTDTKDSKFIYASKLEYFTHSFDEPLLPEAIHDSVLHSYNYDEMLENNRLNFLKILSQAISVSKHTVLPAFRNLKFTSEEYSKRLIPYHCRNDYEATFKLLSAISSPSAEMDYTWPYHVEAAKINAIVTHRLGSSISFKSSIIYDVLNDYNSLFGSRKLDKIKLMFGVNNLMLYDCESSLDRIFYLVIDSIEFFIEMTGKEHFVRHVADLLRLELFRILTIINTFFESGTEGMSNEYADEIVIDTVDLDALFRLSSSIALDPVKITFDDSVASELEIGDSLVYIFDKPQDVSVLIFFIGSDIELSALSIEHAGDLVNNTCFLIKSSIQNEYLIAVVPHQIVRCCEVIKARKKIYDNEFPYFGTNVMLFENFSPALKKLENLDKFDTAIDVLKCHNDNYNEDEIKNDLLNWLMIFPQHYHAALIDVIAAHRAYSAIDINKFVQMAHECQKRPNTILGTIKRFADGGGFHRIIPNFDLDFRRLETELWVNKLEAIDYSQSELIILVELIVSGTQILDSFGKYYLNNNPLPSIVEKNHYFDISRNKQEFISSLCKIKKIRFIAIMSTDIGKNRIESQLPAIFSEVSTDIPEISVDAVVFVRDHENTVDNNTKISKQSQRRFQELINKDEISKFFELTQLRHGYPYEDHINFKSRNLLVRRRTVTKHCFKLFTMIPKESDAKALFSIIKEHFSH